MNNDTPLWLNWAQKIQALAQDGLAYPHNPFDVERYHAFQEIALEMMAHQTTLDTGDLHAFIDAQAGYATPKIDARGVVFRNDQLLLVKELSDGGWTLPGGWVDVGEPPSLAVEREVWEESGYRVKADKLLALYDRNLHGHPPYIFHTYKIYMRCEFLGGEAAESIETAGADFFSEDALPPLSLTRTTPQVLARLFEHHRHPEWPTDFD